MAATRVISIIGRKNAGKTTLTVALAAEFVRRGVRVMTLKHGHHPADADKQGSDSWRHFNEGGAERTLIAGPSTRVLFERGADDYDPLALVRRHLAGADLVLVEGYKRAPLPKLEVHRRETGPPLLDPAAPEADQWVALLTDTGLPGARCRVLRFTDTMWLQMLATLAWERAQVVET